MYIAHKDQETGRAQSIIDHLKCTAKLASEFAEPFGAQKHACFCAMLHDFGKYCKKFQRRINGANISVDHATAGAQLANENGDVISALCIAGHHGGIPDYGDPSDTGGESTLVGRLKKDIENYQAYESEISELPETDILKMDSENVFFYTHMLYSCLVDADWLDTETFYTQQHRTSDCESLSALYQKLENYVSKWWNPEKELDKKRCEILRAAFDSGSSKPGMYSLTAPTGSGKTVASIAFALSHTINKENNINRIIYVIPYVSIIEQTKDVFEKIFGEKNVIAHYANVDFCDDETNKRYLATENWDAPIILTTSVQFFESLFANRSSRCRKLHNIPNSVIIFDEAQMLPPNYLKPCIWAIAQLVKNYGCSAVLCTATQPALDSLLDQYLKGEEVREICPEPDAMYEFFKRVKFEDIGDITNEALAVKLNECDQVLCVVNTRKQALKIFDLLTSDGSYHLTTLMTPEHRRDVLKEIHYRLKNKEPCRVIATSLIEAGVDVDFSVVYREIAGLDSIIQAAGRCNRNGERSFDKSFTYIYKIEKEDIPQQFAQNIDAANRVLRNHKDISSPEAIKSYFKYLYKLMGDQAQDYKGIMKSITQNRREFASIADKFKLIEQDQRTIYIPVGEGENLIKEYRQTGLNRELMRKLGNYAVNVYPYEYKALFNSIEPIAENAAILVDVNLYDKKTGLKLNPVGGQGYIF